MEREEQLELEGENWELYTNREAFFTVGRLVLNRVVGIFEVHLNRGTITKSEIELELERYREEGIL